MQKKTIGNGYSMPGQNQAASIGQSAFCFRHSPSGAISKTLLMMREVTSGPQLIIGKTTVLAMKLTLFFLVVAMLSANASGRAQNVSISAKGLSLQKILPAIEKQTGYVVFANKRDLAGTKTITLSVVDLPLKDFLELLLKDQPLKYRIEDKTIVISRKTPVKDNKQLKKETDELELVNQPVPSPIKGRILNQDGLPLEGASIKLKGSKKGTFTDASGRFSIDANSEDMLVISFTGYIEKEIKVNTLQADANIVLTISDSKLDEVQIIAYGKTSRRLNTGNVHTVKSSVIEKQPVNNPLLALQGRVPGLFIEQSTGFSGTGVKVRIQGKNSIQHGNDPLYVVDGVPFVSQLLPADGGNMVLGNSGASFRTLNVNGNPLSSLNPADIESIDVLTDADATAIYGSRAANGAILITTKKGKAGEIRVNLNVQTGGGKMPNKLNLMNAQQYLEMRKEALQNDGLNPIPGRNGDNDLNGNWDNTRNTDWQKELLGKTARYHDYQASVSGGNGNTSFLLSTGYHKETTVFPGDFSDVKRSVHFNLNSSSANKKFKMNFSGNYQQGNNRLPRIDLTRSAMLLSPVAPALYTADGNVNWQPDASGGTTFSKNPIGYLNDQFNDKTNTLIGNVTLGYELLPGLEIKSSFGYSTLLSDYTSKTRLSSAPPEAIRSGRQRSSIFGHNTIQTWLMEPQITYKRAIGAGKLDVLIGSALQENVSKGSSVMASGFSNDLVMDDVRSASQVIPYSSARSTYRYNAVFGRINYNWQNKYIINLTARRDGSSRFGPESRFHNFGAVGAAWVFTEEDWLRDQLPFLSFGKLRASFGTTGSDQMPDYQFLSLYKPVTFEVPYQNITSYAPDQLSNPNLQWESTRKTQAGLDLGFFKDRLQLNVNYYLNRSDNQVSGYLLAATSGFESIYKNQQFKIKNTGWEFLLSGTVLQTRDFTWTSSFNITIPKTLLLDYPGVDKTSDASKRIIGKPMGSTYAYHLLGVNPQTGVYEFENSEGNPTSNPVMKDQVVIVNPFPTSYGGFHNSFRYKQFTLDLMFQFVKQMAKNYSYGSLQYTVGGFAEGEGNQTVSMLDRWQKQGDDARIQRYSTQFNVFTPLYLARELSDGGISDASYIRLKNLSLAWQFPERWIKTVKLQNASLFLQAQNLLTITNYSGLDPETKSSTILPPLRVITFGAKLGF